MKFLVQHGVGDPAWVNAILEPAAVKGFARAAEHTGWDALAFTDHPAPSGRWIDAGGEGSSDIFSSLGFCAAATETIRLVSFVAALPYHNGLALAHQAATLDRLSAGRLTLGLGVGYLRSELYALGADPAKRTAQSDETVELMLRAWTGAEVDHQGARASAKGIRMQPLPVQQPHPPLWFHGNSRWGVENAVRRGQGWMAMMTDEVLAKTARTTPIPDRDTLERRIAALREAAERHGRDPGEIEIAAVGVWPMLDVRKGWNVDERLADIAALSALGVGWIGLNACGDDPVASEETVRAFGEQVLAVSRR
jgi:probable F420-dependent oxidoreductase